MKSTPLLTVSEQQSAVCKKFLKAFIERLELHRKQNDNGLERDEYMQNVGMIKELKHLIGLAEGKLDHRIKPGP